MLIISWMMAMEMMLETNKDCSMGLDSCWTGWPESPHTFYLIVAPMLLVYTVILMSSSLSSST